MDRRAITFLKSRVPTALRQRAVLLLKLAVAAALIGWLFASGKIDFNQLGSVGKRWPWFALAQVPFGVVMFLCACRWRLLLKAQGIHYSLGDIFSLTMIGQLFNQFMMGTTGGDMVKAYAVAMEQPERRGAGIISVFVDRIVGLLVLVLVALVGILFNLSLIRSRPELVFLAILVVSVFAASLVAGYVFYSDRIRSSGLVGWCLSRLPFRRLLGQLSQAVYVYKFHRREVLIVVALSLLLHVCVVAMNLCLARAILVGPLPWVNFFFLIPLAQIAMAIPINPPGAIGTAEGIYAYLFTLARISEGAMVCLLQRITHYLWALVGCFLYLKRKGKLDQAMAAAHRSEDEKEESESAFDRFEKKASAQVVSAEEPVRGT